MVIDGLIAGAAAMTGPWVAPPVRDYSSPGTARRAGPMAALAWLGLEPLLACAC
ncbi:MAG: nicotinate-nucleotide--dimethylbenzimidazole phosphoribosyltransferase [Caldilineaceae bacterium]|nr:nicotinate-nucleotide--dimethylbenzimidazole phosphoribosyltransferase [Caldilineaceae bacterium]